MLFDPSTLFLGQPVSSWLIFMSCIVVLLLLDLGVFHSKPHKMGIRESVLTSSFYITIGICFGGWILKTYDPNLSQSCAPTCHIVAASEYWTGFIIEKTLSIDNIFVISLIFSYLAIPSKYQHRVLFWGILGVIVLRGTMIALGTTLVAEFHWILYLFSAFLVFTGVKMLLFKDDNIKIEDNIFLNGVRKYLPVTDKLYESKFFVRINDGHGNLRLYCTPLFIALLTIEFVDLIFAVDSVPAVFAITLDPYIVYTSNIFAILGLRALYFLLNAMIDRFAHLKQALAIVLVFIGSKIFITWAFDIEKFPTSISLGVTVSLLLGGVLFSLYKTRKVEHR